MLKFLAWKSNRFLVYAVIISAIAAVYNYYLGENVLDIWVKTPPVVTGLALIAGFIIPALIAVVTTKKGMQVGESDHLHLLKMAVFEEHIIRLAAIITIKAVVNMEIQTAEKGLFILVIALVQMVWFLAIHDKRSVFHMLYSFIWLTLGWYGGLVSAVFSHICANFISRWIVQGDNQ
ncbi:MAG: hypothetical protein H6773_01055 [Pseudomonadales bacterium]|nr:hypothetical protein [Pseudomonadales bacterium]